MNLRLLETIRDHGQRSKRAIFHAFDSSWGSEYISSLMVILWLLFGGCMLVETEHYGNATINVGGFFAVLKSYISANNAYTAIASAALDVVRGVHSLRLLAEHYNI